ncbi:hypothetical protein IFM89_011943 [Coptis chinensis]|uniref:Cyclin N-terminal domain-containing protein n=1 Tax=Coptis chinensis TaxID=261450 RepID=A0A835LEV5_9MAGN|nr:hypothetical protein IFM89_011943 [Coptis chinensis]
MTQLAAVACLSVAAKVEETQVPLLLDLQVEETKYVFEAKSIQRMELLVRFVISLHLLATMPHVIKEVEPCNPTESIENQLMDILKINRQSWMSAVLILDSTSEISRRTENVSCTCSAGFARSQMQISPSTAPDTRRFGKLVLNSRPRTFSPEVSKSVRKSREDDVGGGYEKLTGPVCFGKRVQQENGQHPVNCRDKRLLID